MVESTVDPWWLEHSWGPRVGGLDGWVDRWVEVCPSRTLVLGMVPGVAPVECGGLCARGHFPTFGERKLALTPSRCMQFSGMVSALNRLCTAAVPAALFLDPRHRRALVCPPGGPSLVEVCPRVGKKVAPVALLTGGFQAKTEPSGEGTTDRVADRQHSWAP